MTKLSGNDFVPSDPEISDKLGIIHCPYRVQSFVYYRSSGDLPTRSYIPTVAGVHSFLQRQKIAGRESANSQGRAQVPESL
jgi:hypothetical protein